MTDQEKAIGKALKNCRLWEPCIDMKRYRDIVSYIDMSLIVSY